LRKAISEATVTDLLAGFCPKPGDGVIIEAGTVHSLGKVVVFELQENSDVTFRLYDWDHVDARTGKPRPLYIEQAMACIDFTKGAIGPITPVVEAAKPILRERLFRCKHFKVWRHRGDSRFAVGVAGAPRVLACIAGDGWLVHDGADYAFGKGDVLLLPAEVGTCLCRTHGGITLFEISLPD
jgi:mannose-6-phosphate isomerase